MEKVEKKSNMTKDQKIILISVIGVILVLVVVVILVLTLTKKKEEEAPGYSGNQVNQAVSPEEATEYYTQITNACTGALVWNLQEGEVVDVGDLTNSSACQTDNYFSRLIGYTYDAEENLVMHVNVLKRVENQLYRLDDTLVGEFSEDTLDEMLNYGTTYEYTYQKEEDNYRLAKVSLMEVPTEETNEEE